MWGRTASGPAREKTTEPARGGTKTEPVRGNRRGKPAGVGASRSGRAPRAASRVLGYGITIPYPGYGIALAYIYIYIYIYIYMTGTFHLSIPCA
jgi:hypothetical protein